MKDIQNYYSEVGAYFDLFAEKHLDKSEHNTILTAMRNSFRAFVDHAAPEKILDIGCGPGQDVMFFAEKFPSAVVYGIDVSAKMIACAQQAKQPQRQNVKLINTGIEELEQHINNDTRFDIVYVFFGALNTVSSLTDAAKIIDRLMNPGGKLVLSFVNKYYLSEFLINGLKGRFKKGMSRWGKVWPGYSPDAALASKTYTPTAIQKAFSDFRLIKRKGYSIFFPAWFQSSWLKRFPRLSRVLYKMDVAANKTFLWKNGEYTLFVYEKE